MLSQPLSDCVRDRASTRVTPDSRIREQRKSRMAARLFSLGACLVTIFVMLAIPRMAHAQSATPPAQSIPPRHPSRPFGARPNPKPAAALTASVPAASSPAPVLANNWTPLTNQPTFFANTMLLLTDGRILVQDTANTDWYFFTPDSTGSYINGTWSSIGSMPQQCLNTNNLTLETYAPLYFASAVLPDGRVVIIGGEYNFAISSDATDSNIGEIYDPAANTWTCLASPSSWSLVGDAMSVVQQDGTFLLGNFISSQVATLNLATTPPTWNVINPPGKAADQNFNNEEGWTLLPNGDVFAPEIWNSLDATQTPALVYSPTLQTWSSAGTAPDPLVLLTVGNTNYFEIGPVVVRPDGTVFVTGATGFNDIYNTTTGAWSSGPKLPTLIDSFSCNNVNFTNIAEQYVVADGPAALLPDGHVLIEASPVDANCGWIPPTAFFEFDGTNLTQVAGTPFSSVNVSFNGRLLVLPTGQLMFTDTSNDVEIYTATGTPNPTWAPTIRNSPATAGAGATNMKISGTQLNGLSGAVAYGDDYQAATNYPLVRITNGVTGHVAYARTHGHSSMGIATGSAIVSTYFDVPSNIELGASTLVVVANGIPSTSVPINILKPGVTALASSSNPSTNSQSVTFTATVSGTGGTPTGTVTFYDGATSTAASLGTMSLNGAGLGTFSTSALTIGTHSITAQYNGDSNFGPTTSATVAQVVTGQQNTAVLQSSVSPSVLGQSVTFTATVSGTGGTPTGTVTFLDANSSLDGNTSLGTATLSGGVASISTTSLVVAGTHSMTASYSGDTVFGPTTSAPIMQQVNNPLPAIVMPLSPSTATAGGGDFTLTVNGSNFISGSTVIFNGVSESSQPISSTKIQATINAADIANGGTFSVTVSNPSPGGGTSNSLTFSVMNPVPTISSLSPTHSAAGAAINLTVTGTNFLASSVVTFNGKNEPTTFVSATQLTAAVPASDAIGTSPATVSVSNPSPGGGASQILNLILDNFSVSGPSGAVTVTAGQPAPFSLTVTPSNANGFPNQVTLSASGGPAMTTITFSQNPVSVGTAGGSSTMTITTTAHSSLPGSPKSPTMPLGLQWELNIAILLTAFAASLMLWRGHRTNRYVRYAPLAVLIACVAVAAGCSHGGGGGTNPNSGTPAGTSQITITATSGSAVQTTHVTLTVN